MININLQKIINFDKETYLVVGVSSGPDSMALLHYLKNNTNKELICCHINHNVRRQSKKEAQFLEKYCLTNNIIFETMTIFQYQENNFENEARKKRYSFYEEVLNKYKAKYLFLAHHGDDLIETILMKIVRGSNLEGYAGIKQVSKVKNYYIVRPFLEYTKDDILKYNKLNNIHYFIDKSNKNTKYKRNRYRKYFLPFLKKEDLFVHKKFLRYSKCLLEYDNYLKEEINKNLGLIYHDNCLDISKFITYPYFIQKNMLFTILNNFYDNQSDIVKEKHIIDILALVKNKRPNMYINLPLDVVAIKEYNSLEIKSKQHNKNYCFLLEDYNIIDNHIIKKVASSVSDGNNICRLNSNDLKFPLYLRNRQEKDIIYIKGLNGSKKVKDIFIDEKIPFTKRNSYPLLVDSDNNILWIPNIKKSEFNYSKNENYDIILKYCEKEEKNE